jgi:E3 ubiquitin-protein ligase UBR1
MGVCLSFSFCVSLFYPFLFLVRCGGTIGIYYCVKRCSVLYLNSSIGTFTPSPYLDAHGELDLSMTYFLFYHIFFDAEVVYNSRRGRRQFLHHARWEVIRKTWLSHGIPSMAASWRVVWILGVGKVCN